MRHFSSSYSFSPVPLIRNFLVVWGGNPPDGVLARLIFASRICFWEVALASVVVVGCGWRLVDGTLVAGTGENRSLQGQC